MLYGIVEAIRGGAQDIDCLVDFSRIRQRSRKERDMKLLRWKWP
jgi:hypothetical protein